jgi:hypothetical protein
MKKLTTLAAMGSLVALAGCSTAQPDDSIIETGEQAATTCDTNTGINPTKASLAVAMAMELGRWEATVDLKIDNSTGQVVLSDEGKARCNPWGCPRVSGILGLQDESVNDVISKVVFNATSFREDLKASFQRQNDRINSQVRQELSNTANLSTCKSSLYCAYVPGYPSPTSDGQNNPAAKKNKSSTCLMTPEQHKLSNPSVKVGASACGSQYDLYTYTAKKTDGSSLCQPDNLIYELAFFGQDSGNQFLQFSASADTVTIDPLDADISPPQSSGSGCPTYDLDRVYDPNKVLLYTCCTSQLGAAGTMQAIPRTIGYLGCKANTTTTTTTTTVSEPCTPTATATVAGSYTLNTTGTYCLKVTAPINGWGVSSFDGRTLSIDTYPQTTTGAMPLPAPVNGAHYFMAGAGAYSWAGIYFW